MTRCPSCGASVPAGETICLECGTELVFASYATEEPEPDAPNTAPAPDAQAFDADAPAVSDGARAESSSAPASSESADTGAEGGSPGLAEARITCPDCLESVSPDANQMCPVCGYDFQSPVEIDEEEFFREPPSLDEIARPRPVDTRRSPRAGGRTASAARFPGDASTGVRSSASPAASPAGRAASAWPAASATATSAPAPLPGDRARRRYQVASGEHHAVQEIPMLLVEGGQSVFFDGMMTTRIRLDVDQLLIGRRDPPNGHYPDIDLAHFRHIDEFISRRHARFVRRGSDWVIEDLCANDATFLNDRAHVLNGESVLLKDGDRVLISDSVALTFTLYDPT